MLQGDSADNIVGISGVGAVKAKRYLPDGTDNQKRKKSFAPTTKQSMETSGKTSTTKTPNYYGYGEPYQTNAHSRYRRRGREF